MNTYDYQFGLSLYRQIATMSRQQIILLTVFLLTCLFTLTGWQRAVFYGQNVQATISSGTPTFIQSRSASSITTNSTGTTVNSCATSTYCYYLPEPSLSGNAIIGAVQYSDTGTPTITVTDDVSNTYSVVVTASDTVTNHMRLAMFRAINVTAGARQIRVNFSTNVSKVSAAVSEFNQVATSSADDGNATGISASGSSTMATTTNLAPGQTADLLVQCGARTQTPKGTFTAGSQTNITWAFATTDSVDGLVCQWGQYASTSSFNPQLTMGSNSGFVTAAIALKTANTGSPRPAGPRIVRVCEFNEPTGTTSSTWQCPTDGGTALGFSTGFGGTNYSVTSITGALSSTATHGAIGQLGDGSSGKSDMWYKCGATVGNAEVFTVAASGTVSDYTGYVYVMQGIASSGCFVNGYGHLRASLTTTQVPYVLFFGYQIPPGFDAGISIGNLQQGFNTSQAVTGPCTTFDATTFGGQTLSGGGTHPPSENNGWWHCDHTTSSTALYTIGQADAGTALSSAAGQVAFFKGASATLTEILDTNFTNVANVNPMRTSTQILWNSQGGNSGFQVTSATAQPNSQTFDDGVLWGAGAGGSTVTWPNDQYVQCTLGTLSGTGTESGIGVFLRAPNPATNSGYRVIVNSKGTTPNVWLSRFNAGADTIIATGFKGSAWTSGDIVYAKVVGSTITVRNGVGGSNLINFTDGSPLTSGTGGMSFSSSMTSSSCTAVKGGPAS